jgi:beta-lactamase class C
VLVCGALAVVLGALGAFAVYGNRQLNRIPSLTVAEMLSYTINNNTEAIITVGIIDAGEMSIEAWGENGTLIPVYEKQYEIGSITKTFTAALLFKAISENRISLDDSIDQYLDLPSGQYYPTLKRLITHTSGYRAYYFESPMITNFLARRNSFYGVTNQMVLNRIARVNLENRDYPSEYSNFGIAVIGLVLEEVYGKDYTTLVNEFAQNELGLTSTHISAGAGQVTNGWDWAPGDAYLPAGGLISTTFCRPEAMPQAARWLSRVLVSVNS